MYLDFLCG